MRENAVWQRAKGIGRKLFAAQWFYLLLIILVMGTITSLINPSFLSLSNLRSVLAQISTLGILSAGMTILIISGSFDISIGAIIGFAGTMMCLALDAGMHDIIAMLICLVVAVGCSALNGILSVIFKAPAFIITLATANVYTGLCLFITEGGNVAVFDDLMYFAKYLFNVIPLLFLICLAIYLLVSFLLKRTQFGRRVYAIGNNEQAAYLAGIRIRWSKVMFFVVNGILIAVATILLISRLGASQASTGSGMELQAIGAVIIGGTSITGGKGGLSGTFFGVFLTGIIFNMLNLLRVSPYLQTISFGVLIIISIGISSLRLNRAEG